VAREEARSSLAGLSDDELAARVGVPVSVVPALRGARDLREAREYAEQILAPEHVDVDAPETLGRLRELVEGGLDARGIVRELQAVGADLKAVRLVLTGRNSGPALAAVIESLPRDELLRRISAA
jgi:Anticodon binding domain